MEQAAVLSYTVTCPGYEALPSRKTHLDVWKLTQVGGAHLHEGDEQFIYQLTSTSQRAIQYTAQDIFKIKITLIAKIVG